MKRYLTSTAITLTYQLNQHEVEAENREEAEALARDAIKDLAYGGGLIWALENSTDNDITVEVEELEDVTSEAGKE